MSIDNLYDAVSYYQSGGIEGVTDLVKYDFGAPTPINRIIIDNISLVYELGVISVTLTAGVITGVSIDTAGSGMNSTTLTVVGDGTGAILTPTVDDRGTITNVAITNGGSGYTTASVTVNTTPPAISLIVEVSEDDITYVPLNTYPIDTVEKDIIVNFPAPPPDYRYFKISYAGGVKTMLKIFSMIAYSSAGVATGAKLVDFVFNLDQKYVLVLRENVIYVYYNDVLQDTVIATGLLATYFPTLKVTQAEDTMVFTHPLMRTKQLQRTAGPVWVFGDYPYQNIPKFPFAGEIVSQPAFTLTPSVTEGSIKLTLSGGFWTAGSVGQYVDGNGGRARITEFESATVAYGFTVIPFYTTAAIGSGNWDYIEGYEDVWSVTRGYPTTCMFYEQRLWFGGSLGRPNSIWASRVGQYLDFDNIGNYDNDGINITISSEQIDEIVNLYANRGIQVFTAGAEWVIPETNLTPSTISITKNTSNGSLATVSPVDISGTTLFVEKNGKSLLTYLYDEAQNAYATGSMSLLSDLVDAPLAMTVDYNSTQDVGNFLYIVKADGTMAVACILLDQKINSFVRFETDGIIQDAVNVAGDTYLLVDRDFIVYLEKIAPFKTDLTTTHAPAQVITGLGEYNGKTVYAYTDTQSYGTFVVSGDQIDLGVVPTENVYIGLPFQYEMISNKVAINGQTDNIEKRISKATVVTSNTDRLIFQGQDLIQADNRYDIYSITGFQRDCRFTVSGEFDYVELLSVLLNINYGVK